MAENSGIRLECDGVLVGETFEDVNARLQGIGAWPLDLSDLPADLRRLIDEPVLTEEENRRLKSRFLLGRERLLEIIAELGRSPHFPDGGSLESYCIETQTAYPQLHVIAAGADYSGFYPFHVNLGEDGRAVDEIGCVLSGGPMVYRFRQSDGSEAVLSMTCRAPDRAWRFAFDGMTPHGGILEKTPVGTKILVQAIGPEKFHLTYV